MNAPLDAMTAARLRPPVERRPAGLKAAVALAVAAACTLAAAEGVQAWLAWRHGMASPVLQAGGTGALVSVTLIGGQVYYGNLVESSAGFVKLENVYYVQSQVNPTTNQPDNRLVNRRKADWHGPAWMAIPVEKVVTLEGVGAGSRLAGLIEQEKKLPAP